MAASRPFPNTATHMHETDPDPREVIGHEMDLIRLYINSQRPNKLGDALFDFTESLEADVLPFAKWAVEQPPVLRRLLILDSADLLMNVTRYFRHEKNERLTVYLNTALLYLLKLHKAFPEETAHKGIPAFLLDRVGEMRCCPKVRKKILMAIEPAPQQARLPCKKSLCAPALGS